MKAIKEIYSITTLDNLSKNRKRKAEKLKEEIIGYFQKDEEIEKIIESLIERVYKISIEESKDIAVSLGNYLNSVIYKIILYKELSVGYKQGTLDDNSLRTYKFLESHLSFIKKENKNKLDMKE